MKGVNDGEDHHDDDDEEEEKEGFTKCVYIYTSSAFLQLLLHQNHTKNSRRIYIRGIY